MDNLDAITEQIQQEFETRNAARDKTLERSRALVRYCANAIKAIQREEWDTASERLQTARDAAAEMTAGTQDFPDLFVAGYTQDALKEYVEAVALHAMVRGESLPEPHELAVPSNTYLNGLAEAASELRRRILDLMRRNQTDDVERLLEIMDTVYSALAAFDFPDAITGGLRRRNDALRGVVQRTWGDVTNDLRRQQLVEALNQLESRLDREA